MRFTQVVGADALREYSAELEDLAASASETNVFYEPWMLSPAIDSYGGGKDLRFVLAFADDGASARARLCGFIPLERRSRYYGLPIPRLTLWRYPHSFLSTPILREGYEAPVWDGLIRWLESDHQGAVLLELCHVSASGPVHSALEATLAGSPHLKACDSRYQRALFVRDKSAGRYLENVLSKKKRKEYRRLERRLGDHGEVAWDELRAGGDASRWISDFLELEASGWKGRAGTAFASESTNRDYFCRVAREAFARGRLRMLALRLDGRAIAIKCNLVGTGGGFAFKIAYDEQFHRYSPGVLLELEQIRRLHESAELDWVDSCAAPDHFMANRLWPERRPMRTVLMSTGHALGNAAVTLVGMAKRARARFAGGASRLEGPAKHLKLVRKRLDLK